MFIASVIEATICTEAHFNARVDERNEKHRIMENLATGRNHTLFAKIAEQGWIL